MIGLWERGERGEREEGKRRRDIWVANIHLPALTFITKADDFFYGDRGFSRPRGGEKFTVWVARGRQANRHLVQGRAQREGAAWLPC